jgi:chromate reductase
MNSTYRVAVLVGSLRQASITRRVAAALADVAPAELTLEQVEMGDLPLYNQDFDDQHRVPAEWAEFRRKIAAADAVLFVTPEYNRSIPGVLKNAIDVGSRPYGQSVWSGKPAAVVSVSPGLLGAFGANHHLRQMLVFLNMPTLQQPEAYISNAAALFDQQGNLVNDKTRELLRGVMAAFANWIALTAPVAAAD